MSLPPFLLELLKKPAEWIDAQKTQETAVLSSALVLRRNFENFPFPVNCSGNQKSASAKISDALMEQLKSVNPNIKFQAFSLDSLTSDERAFLSERDLILSESVQNGREKFLYICENGGGMPNITVNEDCHIRFCSRTKGLNLKNLWDNMKAAERIYSSHAKFACHPKFGYLCEKPEHTGTGLTGSALMHIPGFFLSGKTEMLLHSLESLRLKGVSYFGRNYAGRLLQIVSASSLGETEEQLIKRFTFVVSKIDAEELRLRKKILCAQSQRMNDITGRAYGLLRYANLLSEEEALNGLMTVQFGKECGFPYQVPNDFLHQNFMRIRAAHTYCLIHESNSMTKKSSAENKAERCALTRAAFLRNDLLGIICRN